MMAMLAVRYAALAALVVWLGGMATIELLDSGIDSDVFRRFHMVAYTCGAVVFICLFILKFVGPPPHGFVPRAAIVVAMLGLQLYSDRMQVASTILLTLTLGFGLLFWYVRE